MITCNETSTCFKPMLCSQQQATPLFLSKSDLDIALKTAGRNQSQQMADQLKQQAANLDKRAQDAWEKASGDVGNKSEQVFIKNLSETEDVILVFPNKPKLHYPFVQQ